MRRFLLAIAGLALFAVPVSAQTADEIVAKYIKTVGGMDKIQAVKTLRRTGKFTGGGGFEAVIIEENKRPNLVRQEFSLQGMTQINAYDGKSGWKIVWINPNNTDHLIVGDDGGVWYSYDGGNRWWKGENLPVSQFYHVSVDMEMPYRVYGGLQDNSSWV